MERTGNQQPYTPGIAPSPPSPEGTKAVKEVVASLLAAVKNHGLYPENHTICRNSSAKLENLLQDYLGRFPSLRLQVDKEKLLFMDRIIHEGPPGPDNLAFILFRDGIQWLEFHAGLEGDEIRALLNLLNTYKKLQEEAEGDLVTAMWEADFSNIRYGAVDLNWDAAPLDLSLPNSAPLQETAGDEETLEGDSGQRAPDEVVRVEEPGMELTPEETAKLQEMVSLEETRDTVQDLTEVVLAILDDQTEEKALAELFNFLQEEFRDILSHGEFLFAHKFLSDLHQRRKGYGTEKPWAVPLLDRFLVDLSSPRVLSVLSQIWPTFDEFKDERVRILRNTLLLLSPDAVCSLGPMLHEIHSPGLQRTIMEVIGRLAERDLGPLERLLDRPEEFMLQRLVFIVGHLKGEQAEKVLRKMAAHPSEKVRRQAVSSLLSRDPQAVERLFHLIEDPGESVRRVMFDHLGSARNEIAERLLLTYLGTGEFKLRDPDHLLSCYRTLGRCGSRHSVPFLGEALLGRGWLPELGKSVHRAGAATALRLLGTEEAQSVLRKASRSLVPSVRKASREAMEGSE